MKIVKTAMLMILALSVGVFGVSVIISLAGRDASAPVITSDTDVLEIPCDYTQDQLMAGLSASDAEDGDLTDQIVAGSFSRFVTPGVTSLTYVVFDSGNQPASLTREVHFTDYHGPRFTLSEPLVFREQEGSYTEAMERLGAKDQLDGDLDDWITQTDTDLNYSQAGRYTMSVEVNSSLGSSASADLPVHVVSAESQQVHIGLTQGIVYIPQGGSIDPKDYIDEVTDGSGNPVDASSVSADSGVDVNTPGCYEIHYTADSGAGETWLTVIVEGGES